MNDKIKHLLSTAYKTDSIAKNKWRIENREQLREQRKKELKELMEKDKTMSNNKQLTEQMVISQTASTSTAQGIWVKHLKIKGGDNE
jgi:predicted amino acid dehydrogenase